MIQHHAGAETELMEADVPEQDVQKLFQRRPFPPSDVS